MGSGKGKQLQSSRTRVGCGAERRQCSTAGRQSNVEETSERWQRGDAAGASSPGCWESRVRTALTQPPPIAFFFPFLFFFSPVQCLRAAQAAAALAVGADASPLHLALLPCCTLSFQQQVSMQGRMLLPILGILT